MKSEQELKALISKYRICWSIYPENERVDGATLQVGFRLELYGTYPPEVVDAGPGYVRCFEVWAALKDVAERIRPMNIREFEYEVQAHNNANHHSSIRRNRRDVELHVRIIHRCVFGRDDLFEIVHLREITTNLERLGAPED